MPAPPTGNHYPSTPAPGNRNRECYVESETRSLAGYAQCVLLMNMFDNLANIIPSLSGVRPMGGGWSPDELQETRSQPVGGVRRADAGAQKAGAGLAEGNDGD